MDRWDELERIGKLRAEGLLSDEEFEAQKRSILEEGRASSAEIAIEAVAKEGRVEDRRAWIKIAIGGSAIVVLILLIWLLLSPSTSGGGNSSDAVLKNAAPVKGNAPSQTITYALRSNVPNASLVRLEQLPTVTPYGDNSEDFCGERFRRPLTPGGQLAEQRGWRVVEETQFHGLDAVLVVRGYDPGTSGHCFSKDPNVAFFDGDRLIGVLYSSGQNGVGMNNIANVGRHLRVWDDLSAVGQVTLNETELTFDRVTGSDEVCDGRYRVPVVYGQTYSNARRILGRSGWVARPSTEEVFEGDRTTDYRTRFPEVNSCSGTGYAYCSFGLMAEDGVARLSITTAGEDDDPVVTDYDVSCDGRQDL